MVGLYLSPTGGWVMLAPKKMTGSRNTAGLNTLSFIMTANTLAHHNSGKISERSSPPVLFCHFLILQMTFWRRFFFYRQSASLCWILVIQITHNYEHKTRLNAQTIHIHYKGLLHSHLPNTINHHEHLSCFKQLWNTMTAKALASPCPCDLEWTSRSFKLK